MKLRVMLVDDNRGRSAVLEQALEDAGQTVVCRVGADEDLTARVRDIEPDIIIVDMQLPGRDTLEHMHSISREQPRPIVMFAEEGDSKTIEEAVRAGVSAYVVDGLSASRVKPVIDVAVARFREFHALRAELDKTKATLEERKVVDRAKGILMKQRNCSEDAAYQLLRKVAMDSNKRIIDVARNIIEMASLLMDK
jgi:response regulator NasT